MEGRVSVDAERWIRLVKDDVLRRKVRSVYYFKPLMRVPVHDHGHAGHEHKDSGHWNLLSSPWPDIRSSSSSVGAPPV